MADDTYIYSENVLIDGAFRPAGIRIVNGVIVEILDLDPSKDANRKLQRCLNFSPYLIGPGLIDIGVEFCAEGFLGGVTTIAEPSPVDSSLVLQRFDRAESIRLPSLKCVDSPSLCESNALYIKADRTNKLASPLNGVVPKERLEKEGNRWRTGRSRRGSDDEYDDQDDEGIKIPPSMLAAIVEREKATYATPAFTAKPDSDQVLKHPQGGKSRARPAPLSLTSKAPSAFEPSFFLRDYGVHLTLRPRESELNDVDELIRTNALGVLRLSTREGLVRSKALAVRGATVAHLLFSENDVGFGATHFKLDPPLRGENDRLALIQSARLDEAFIVSSGHTNRGQIMEDFERTSSNGETMCQFLPALWTVASALEDPLKIMALFWLASSKRPARVLGLSSAGEIKVGNRADLAVFDLNGTTSVELGGSNVFQGRPLKGRVIQVFADDKPLISS